MGPPKGGRKSPLYKKRKNESKISSASDEACSSKNDVVSKQCAECENILYYRETDPSVSCDCGYSRHLPISSDSEWDSDDPNVTVIKFPGPSESPKASENENLISITCPNCDREVFYREGDDKIECLCGNFCSLMFLPNESDFGDFLSLGESHDQTLSPPRSPCASLSDGGESVVMGSDISPALCPKSPPRTKKHKKRRALVDPARKRKRQEQKMASVIKRKRKDSEENLLHSQQMKECNAKIKSSKTKSAFEEFLEEDRVRKAKRKHWQSKRAKRNFIQEQVDYNAQFQNDARYQPQVNVNAMSPDDIENERIAVAFGNRERQVEPEGPQPGWFAPDRRRFKQHNTARVPFSEENPGPPRTSIGPMNVICEFCGSRSFEGEEFNCCGKVKLLSRICLLTPMTSNKF